MGMMLSLTFCYWEDYRLSDFALKIAYFPLSIKTRYMHIYVCTSVYIFVYLQSYVHNLCSKESPTDMMAILLKKRVWTLYNT